MKKHIILLIAIVTFSSISLFAGAKIEKKMYVAEIETSHGDIVIALLNETPLHRANFIKNSKDKLYNTMKFHRVIKGFVIQTGDPKTKSADFPKSEYGVAGNGVLVKAEIHRNAIHTIGAVGMARENDKLNPNRDSSGSHFYIVTGNNEVTEEDINKAEAKSGYKYSEEERACFIKNGGAPRLDGAYVVFGYVLEGMKTVGVIENAEKNSDDVPNDDYVIESIKIKKMSKKAIEKKYNYYAR